MKVDFSIYHSGEAGFEIKTKCDEGQPFKSIAFEDDDFSFFLKGALLNKNILINSLGISHSMPDLVHELYRKYSNNFSKSFEGEYSGFLLDKKSEKLMVFGNLTGSQTVFYYFHENCFLVDTSLYHLKKSLDQYHLPYTLDIQSAYSTLTFHSLTDHHTHISEIKRLKGGQQLIFHAKNSLLSIHQLDSLHDIEHYNGLKSDALRRLDDIFSHAVNLEYSYDRDIGKGHFSLLSGGLDSRMGIFYAKKNHFENIHALCFSHSGYLDETIARKIAAKLDLSLQVKHLNGGQFLMHIDRLTAITQGLTRYTGGAHSDFALQTTDFASYGLIHTGHLGDAVLGSYLSGAKSMPPSAAYRKMYAGTFFHDKTQQLLEATAGKYPTEELFLFYNRGFNAIAVGNFTAEEHSIAVSPFMHPEFLKFGLSLPEKWRYNENIYIEWISKYCKESTAFIWERTRLHPNKKWKTSFGDKFWVRLNGLYYKKILGKPELFSMTPYEYYYQTNPLIKQYFDKYFEDNIYFIKEKELKQDCELMFKKGNFTDKTLVLSLLGVYKWLAS